MKYKAVAAGLSLCLLVGSTGCREGAKTEKEANYTIGVVTKSRNSEYWLSVCAGMEQAAKDLQAEVLILSPDTESEKNLQKSMIEDLLKKEIQALAVLPIDSYDNQDYLEQAQKAEIPVYAYDMPIEDAEVPYIGIDHEKIGRELAEELAKALGHKGQIGIISGDFQQAGHRQRVEGFEAYLAQEPGISVEMVRSGYSNLQVSQQEIEEILAQYPELDGIMTTSAVTALGLAEAMEGTGIALVSVDAQEDAIRAVQEGKLTALGAQSGYEIGYETIDYIVGDLKGEAQEEGRILEAEVLTRENAANYQEAHGEEQGQR